ncbi:MAG TPA: hypothetical protein VN824_00560, partial [Puia sp.]|nr:hypothetical protein [Puia sp.]
GRLTVDPGAEVLLTFIPQFPVYPPEKAWMRIPRTDIPRLIVRHSGQGERDPEKSGRIVFIPADLDRQYGRSNLPDHGNLLRNIVNWAAEGSPGAAGSDPRHIPVVVEGAGLVDTHLYQQPGRMILHLVNLTNENTWRQPLDELIPIGPLKVKVKLTAGLKGSKVSRLVGVANAGAAASGPTAGAAASGVSARSASASGKTAGAAITSHVTAGWCHFEINSITDHEVIVIA